MRARWLTVLAVAAVLGVLSSAATPAEVVVAAGRDGGDGGGGGGESGGGSDTGGGVDENGDPIVVAVDPGSPGSSVPTPGDEDSGGPVCWWEVVIADDSDYPFYRDDGTPIFSATGRWLRQYCDGEVVTTGGWYWAVPEGGIVIPGELAREAAEAVAIADPVVGTSPAPGRLVVRVPTWLWIDGSWWQTYEATATAGRVTATVTATPLSAVWTTGDGAMLTCGAGVPWQPGAAVTAETCVHTYTVASPATGYELTVAVDLALSWTSNVGVSGTLDPIPRSSTQTVTVGEIQAVGTS